MSFEVEMEMKHFSHDHLLKLLEKTGDHDNMSFGCCDGSYSWSVDDNQVYGCEECNYFIHKTCSEIPQEIQHFFHPDHLIKLCVQQAEEEVDHCVACYCKYNNSFFTYRCAECPDFNMDVECALLPNKLQASSKSIHYRHHDPPLTLHERTADDGPYYCSVCGTPSCPGGAYRCDECNISYHESCTQVDLPLEIQHYFHPHPLRLITNNGSKWWSECLACQGDLRSSVFYECLGCTAYMHDDCALLPEKLKQDDHKHDFSHGHPLSLCDSKGKLCKACKQPCGDPTTYGCKRCKYYIHESCTGLPLQINHPLHPPHLLTLTLNPETNFFDNDILCDGCGIDAHDFLAYKCGECDFLLDVDCGGRTPTITFEDHDHIMTLTTRKIDNSPYSIACIVCLAPIPVGSLHFSSADSHSYYKLHLLCGPLPCTIKDKCHVDPLKLMDAFVEDYNETDEVYCDTCEELRDPNEPVYYCKECNFITEIKCVMPEVLRCLEGHNGNVKLRTANNTKIWYSGMVFSFQFANIVEEDDILIETEREIKYVQEKYFEVKLDMSYKGLVFFTTEEAVQILQIFQEAGVLYSLSETMSEMSISETMENADLSWSKLLSSIREKQVLTMFSPYAIGEVQSESDIVSVVPSYSNEALTSLMEKLDSFYGDVDLVSKLDKGAEIVGIGELMIMQDLASYLKGLLHTHGDFTANSTLEPRLKMFFLNLLCDVVRSMCFNNVREVDEKMLWKWWKSLQTVKHAGFEVQFVIDRLSRIAIALFGMRVRATFAKTKCQIEENLDEVKELKAKLDAKERELEALKLNLVLQKKAMEFERSPEMKECLEYESVLKWKKAWEGSPVMFQKIRDGSRYR